ncbi:hypothetical protein GCM10011585_32790 [Edaphobacter dinghuensis]|uniref:Uncharacterized protein n=1 Tax=Edaphobacter dinghuensis TaxID=1560005 RepID=A0A917MB16_9BACT|nr:hypothetical protein GCM10011585_32790 [Edaphobacter dinghuensis]
MWRNRVSIIQFCVDLSYPSCQETKASSIDYDVVVSLVPIELILSYLYQCKSKQALALRLVSTGQVLFNPR